MADMTLTHYLELSRQLVKNQMQMVDEHGYCMSWTGFSVQHFKDVDQYKSVIKSDILHWIKNSKLNQDVDDAEATIDQFLRECDD